MAQCEICHESTNNFNTDIRMIICDECLVEMNEYINSLPLMESEVN